ncbi:peptide chain release factor N(5)-glutamine methyltransferase [Sporosarcina thermotolerans]|uniref:Release factor glutamine methyltransferase n=1 Tax=Sporosarcina thermotolerans TaxID=633404 RepID=A0AAW9A915_9BACL|nr:peptide chain release factor N(5)-glutamine methyltransferase [Sporosarcina thermotolerans]MDW0116395.1 peptide chain release factor N(5)-glutamine methyltransferase [Sporosarcina thermotolerans]WHT48352.1 peptide chain release factor N(5)-glutamine methyltransferase [Sporosarcina thermotolerans]
MTEKIHEALNKAKSLLESKDLDAHAVHLLMEHVTGKSGATLLADLREPLTPKQQTDFWNKTEQLLTGKPVQHIIGTEQFYGMSFDVNKNVLIPRPETEELVYGVLERCRNLFPEDGRVADIGTGSGAIAIAIKKEWPDAFVVATDISEPAIAVAKRNAKRNEVHVEFRLGNMTEPIEHEKWDVVVSNPPYVTLEESKEMSRTVLDFEPHTALFAMDDGLYFYKKLAKSLPPLMNKPALIAVEIGYQQGKSVSGLFQKAFPKARVSVRKDLNGKDRMIFCEISE